MPCIACPLIVPMQLQLTSMGLSRGRVRAAICAVLSGIKRGQYLATLAQLTDGQLAAMDLEDGEDDETIVGFLQGETQHNGFYVNI